MTTKYKRDEKSIELLNAAAAALADYRDHIRLQYGRETYQLLETRQAMLQLKELLREERRGWLDIRY